MKHIKVGDICVYDENNFLNLRDYNIVKVRVVKKFLWWYYVLPVEPVIYPTLKSGYIVKVFKTRKKYLRVSDEYENIVIRTPLNAPKFNTAEVLEFEKTLKKINDAGILDANTMALFTSILIKAKYSIQFKEVETHGQSR